MQQILLKGHCVFSDRKISVDQAIKVLRRNSIETNEEQAKVILDFLYLLAKMLRDKGFRNISLDITPEREIEH